MRLRKAAFYVALFWPAATLPLTSLLMLYDAPPLLEVLLLVSGFAGLQGWATYMDRSGKTEKVMRALRITPRAF
jgi:hypothetical protein